MLRKQVRHNADYLLEIRLIAGFYTDPAILQHITLDNAHLLRKFKYMCILTASNLVLLLHILRTSPPQCISEMWVKFWGGFKGNVEAKLKSLEEFDWTSLDVVLSSSRFKALSAICIEIDYLNGVDALQEFLAKHLPLLHKRRVRVNELDMERYGLFANSAQRGADDKLHRE